MTEDYENLKERKNYLTKRLKEIDRMIQDSKKSFNLLDQEQISYQQEIDKITAYNDSTDSKLKLQIEELKSELRRIKACQLQATQNRSEKISLLRNEVQTLTETLNVITIDKLNDVSLDNTFEDVEMLDEVSNKEQIIKDIQDSIICSKNLIICKERELEEIHESVKFANSELKEAVEVMNNTNRKVATVKSELHQLQRRTTHTQINSLFHELADTRGEAKEKFENLKRMHKEAESNMLNAENQIVLLKRQQCEINDMLTTYPSQSAGELATLIKVYRDTLLLMEKINSEYEKVYNEKEELINMGFPEDVSRFYENLIKKNKNTRARLNDLINGQYLANRAIYSQIHENEVQLIRYNVQIKELYKQIYETRNSIKERKAALEEEKENLLVEIDASKVVTRKVETKQNVPVEKKVQFAENVVDPPPPRRGGRIPQCKSYHFPSLTTKKI